MYQIHWKALGLAIKAHSECGVRDIVACTVAAIRDIMEAFLFFICNIQNVGRNVKILNIVLP